MTRAASLSLAALVVVATQACGGQVVFEGPPDDGGGLGGGSPASTSAGGNGDVDLGPVCDAFCAKYHVCAPVADCETGCLSSFASGCKKPYASLVSCEADHLVSCSFGSSCTAEQDAYAQCVGTH